MKKALLIVSFGVTTKEAREKTLDLYKKEVEASFPHYDVFIAYSSRRIIGKVKQREGLEVDYPLQALEKLMTTGYEKILIQPFSVISSEALKTLGTSIKAKHVKLLPPLLHTTSEDSILAKLILQGFALNEKEALLFVGHGSATTEQDFYVKFNDVLEKLEIPAFLGTIKGHLTIETISQKLRESGIESVRVKPFLLTKGHHVTQDIKKMWVEGLKSEGFKVEVDLKPLGEYPAIRQHFIHLIKE